MRVANTLVVLLATAVVVALTSAAEPVTVTLSSDAPNFASNTVAVTATFSQPVDGVDLSTFKLTTRGHLFDLRRQLQYGKLTYILKLTLQPATGTMESVADEDLPTPEQAQEILVSIEADSVQPSNSAASIKLRWDGSFESSHGRHLTIGADCGNYVGYALSQTPTSKTQSTLTTFTAASCCANCRAATSCAGWYYNQAVIGTVTYRYCSLYNTPDTTKLIKTGKATDVIGPLEFARCTAIDNTGKNFGFPSACTNNLDTDCTMACNTNYVQTAGNTTRTCKLMSDNTVRYDRYTLTCTYNCGTVPTPTNGAIVSCSGNNLQGAVCRTACNTNYGLASGDESRTCNVGGWSGVTPQCYRQCVPLTAPTSATISCTNGGRSLEGDSCTVTCDSGYDLLGTQTRTCSNGVYGGTPASCIRNCGALPAVSSSTVSCTGTRKDDKCTYACSSNYRLTDGTLVRTCNEAGWSGSAPVCSRVCDTPTGTNAIVSSCPSTLEGESCTLSCIDGFYLTSGTLTRTCQTSGSWTGTAPVCARCQCSACQICDPTRGCITRPATDRFVCKKATNQCQIDAVCDGSSTTCPAYLIKTTSDCQDADGDRFYAFEDCNDNDNRIYPGAPEAENSAVDYNCDGVSSGAAMSQLLGTVMSQMIRARTDTDALTVAVAKQYVVDPVLVNFPIPKLSYSNIGMNMRMSVGTITPPVLSKNPATGVVSITKPESVAVYFTAEDLHDANDLQVGYMSVRYTEDSLRWKVITNTDGTETQQLVVS